MKKRIISLALALVLAIAVMPVSFSAVTATPNAATVYVDGESVAFDAYTINQENYFKLRDVMYIFMGTRSQFNAIFDTSATPTVIKLTSGATYTPDGSEMQAKGTGSKTPNLNPYAITLDGKEINITAYEIDGNNYFKMRDLAIALDFYVGYDGAITIDTSRPYEGTPQPTAEPMPTPTPAPSGTSARDAVKYERKNVTASGRSFSVHTITVDIKNPNIGIEVMMPNRKLNNTVSFSSATNARRPIAAINGNFFNAYDAIKDPIGHLMSGGEFLYTSAGIASMGITKDRDIIFGQPGVFTRVKTVDSPQQQVTAYEINVRAQAGNQAVLYTPARGDSIAITHSGLVIEVVNSVVTRQYNVTPGATATIPSDGYIVYFNETVTKNDWFRTIDIGRRVEIEYTPFPADDTSFDLANSVHILSGAPRLVTNGSIDTAPLPGGFAGDNRFSVNSAPRTAVGRLSDGKLIMASIPSSTIAQLKEIMLTLGCTDAINIDGGASTAMYYDGSVLASPGRELTSILMIVEN